MILHAFLSHYLHFQLAAWPALPRAWCVSLRAGTGVCGHNFLTQRLVWQLRTRQNSPMWCQWPVVGSELLAAIQATTVNNKGPRQNELQPRNNVPSQWDSPGQIPLSENFNSKLFFWRIPVHLSLLKVLIRFAIKNLLNLAWHSPPKLRPWKDRSQIHIRTWVHIPCIAPVLAQTAIAK